MYGVLEHPVAKRCSFGQRIHWFHENGGSILSMVKQNAVSSVKSRLLGDRIRNEEAIRPRAVVLLSSEPGAASEKVKLCSRPTVTQEKNKRLLAV